MGTNIYDNVYTYMYIPLWIVVCSTGSLPLPVPSISLTDATVMKYVVYALNTSVADPTSSPTAIVAEVVVTDTLAL